MAYKLAAAAMNISDKKVKLLFDMIWILFFLFNNQYITKTN